MRQLGNPFDDEIKNLALVGSAELKPVELWGTRERLSGWVLSFMMNPSSSISFRAFSGSCCERGVTR